ncbi:MAG TPA: hypothetical protein VFR81_13710 [Longimicrobium sp.]|nr:hypothetical protein [Longimicrobium sp.]
MRNAAESAALEINAPAAPARTILPLPVEDVSEREVREELVRRMAADRLRDLKDDGVTMAYVARMYGVDRDVLERVSAELLPRRSR